MYIYVLPIISQKLHFNQGQPAKVFDVKVIFKFQNNITDIL